MQSTRHSLVLLRCILTKKTWFHTASVLKMPRHSVRKSVETIKAPYDKSFEIADDIIKTLFKKEDQQVKYEKALAQKSSRIKFDHEAPVEEVDVVPKTDMKHAAELPLEVMQPLVKKSKPIKPLRPLSPEKIQERQQIRESVQELYVDENETNAVVDHRWYEGQVHEPLNQESQEFIPKWMKVASKTEPTIQENLEEMDVSDVDTLLQCIVRIINENYGSNTTVIDVRERCDTIEYMVITEGRSAKQLYAIADAVKRFARKKIPFISSSPATTGHIPPNLKIEGEDCDDWMLLDMGSIMLHCFVPEARKHYDLDSLWRGLDPEMEALKQIRFEDVEPEQYRMTA